MKKIEFNPLYRASLQDSGFVIFDDFFADRNDCELLSHERSNSVHRVRLSNGDSEQIFFLKRSFSERPRKVFRSWLRGKHYNQSAIQELKNIQNFSDHDINVMDVAAWGESRIAGYPISSFLIVPEVEGSEFIDFYDHASFKERKDLFCKFGTLVGKVDRLGLDTEIRPQDVFCSRKHPDDKLELILIDREEGSTEISVPNSAKVSRAFGVMFVKGVIRYQKVAITNSEAVTFCKAYVQSNPTLVSDWKALYKLAVNGIRNYIEEKRYAKSIIPLLSSRLLGDD